MLSFEDLPQNSVVFYSAFICEFFTKSKDSQNNENQINLDKKVDKLKNFIKAAMTKKFVDNKLKPQNIFDPAKELTFANMTSPCETNLTIKNVTEDNLAINIKVSNLK